MGGGAPQGRFGGRQTGRALSQVSSKPVSTVSHRRFFPFEKSIASARTLAQCQASAGLPPRPMLAHRVPAAALLPNGVLPRRRLCRLQGERGPANTYSSTVASCNDLGEPCPLLSEALLRLGQPGGSSIEAETLSVCHRQECRCHWKPMPSIESKTSRIYRAAFLEDTMMPASPLAPLPSCDGAKLRMLAERASQVFWDSSVPGRPARRGLKIRLGTLRRGTEPSCKTARSGPPLGIM